MLKKNSIFMCKSIQQFFFFGYIKLPVCIFINTLNELTSMIFNSALKFLMLSRFGHALEKYEAFNKKLSILQNG